VHNTSSVTYKTRTLFAQLSSQCRMQLAFRDVRASERISFALALITPRISLPATISRQEQQRPEKLYLIGCHLSRIRGHRALFALRIGRARDIISRRYIDIVTSQSEEASTGESLPWAGTYLTYHRQRRFDITLVRTATIPTSSRHHSRIPTGGDV
jgi:hypothetical protein